MPDKLLVATRNTHKKQEIEEILRDIKITLLSLDEVSMPEIEEDGSSFAENALKKARTIAALSGFITLADDSGLMVDALGGQPGVYSARFAGIKTDDAQNNKKLLALLQGVGEADRGARFKCVIAISTPNGKTEMVEGVCEGQIAVQPSGKGGFGYDPLFIPAGYQESFAQLPAEIKNRISHRAQALRKARPVLERFLGNI